MREESLLCQIRKGFVVTTDSQHSFVSYPNLLKARTLTRPSEAWCADITYIRLPSCFCHLAAIMDVFSRYLVGWHLSKDIATRLTLSALEMGLQRRCPPPGLIPHSDRGVQYASSAYIARLEQAGALPSMAARGNPYDNAFAESFFKTLKREEVYLNEYRSFLEANDNLGRFLEAVYNHKRLHSSLGYLPPHGVRGRLSPPEPAVTCLNRWYGNWGSLQTPVANVYRARRPMPDEGLPIGSDIVSDNLQTVCHSAS